MLVVLVLPFAPPVRTAVTSSFVVDSNSDGVDANIGDGVCQDATGHCTLRAALLEANWHMGAYIITFSVDGTLTLTLTLTSNLPTIDDELTISGNGAANRIIDGNGSYQGLHVLGAVTVNLIGMTVRNGHASDGDGRLLLRIKGQAAPLRVSDTFRHLFRAM